VLVHGIGRQRLNASLQSFARAVAGPDVPLYSYAVPAGVGTPDQKRLSAVLRADDDQSSSTNVDFYELYWADLMSDGAVEPLLRFLATLAWRPATGVPPALVAAHYALWAAILAVLFVAGGIAAYAPGVTPMPLKLFAWASAVMATWRMFNRRAAAYVVFVAGALVTAAELYPALAWGALSFAGHYAPPLPLCAWALIALAAWWMFNRRVAAFMFVAGALVTAAELYPAHAWGALSLAGLYATPLVLCAWGSVALAAWWGYESRIAAYVLVAPTLFTAGLYPVVAWGALSFAGLYATAYTVIHTALGNSLCYLLLDPARVADRRAIQRRGVELLRALHAARYAGAPKPFYNDLVVVGHSMGSVVALDVLHQLFAATAVEFLREVTPTAELRAAEAAAAALARNGTSRKALSAYWRTQRALQGHPDIKAHWRVSALVTLGSPLAHADVLLGEGPEKLREQVDCHELPSCPPVLEPAGTPFEGCFSYRFGGNKDSDETRRMSRSAVFGSTQWTNLYFPMVSLLDGDVIGGPVAPRFGPGVDDQALTGPAGRFLHTAYWEALGSNDAHLRALREALGIGEQQPQ
jgi:hypothetical protein